MTIEAALGTDAPFDERLQRLRPHPGQAASATNLRRLLDGSPILDSHRTAAPRAGRVLAPVRAAGPRRHARRPRISRGGVLEIELNAVSDNPIVLPDDGDVVSRRQLPRAAGRGRDGRARAATVGSREHQRTPSLPAARPDALERAPAVPRPRERAQQRVHARPVHRRLARLRIASRSRIPPRSIRSRPRRGQEDHVSHGDDGGSRHAARVVANAEIVLALEALGAAQALDLRAPLEPGPATARGEASAPRTPCRSSRRTGSSVPISRRRSSWFDPAGWSRPPKSVSRPARLSPQAIGSPPITVATTGLCPGRYGHVGERGPVQQEEVGALPRLERAEPGRRCPSTHAGFAVAAVSASSGVIP